MKSLSKIALVLLIPTVLASGCASTSRTTKADSGERRGIIASIVGKFRGNKQAAKTKLPAAPLPATKPDAPAAVDQTRVVAPARGDHQSIALLRQDGLSLTPATPRYTVNRPEHLRLPADQPADEAASRFSTPAEYRVLYFPGEQGEDWASESARVTVKIKAEEIQHNPFASGRAADGNVVVSKNSFAPTATEYIAPSRSVVNAASRLSAVRGDGSNVALFQGVARTSEYRRVRVALQGGRFVDGYARPLGVIGGDPQSVQAAKQALNAGAGEELVYFPNDFGWGGFIADDSAQ